MGYSIESQIPTASVERELLLAGRSYSEVAAATGGRVKSISERNRIAYQIDIWDAFARRIERDGIPTRLNVSDAFGYWFAGLFDGEGSIGLFTRTANDPRYSEFRMYVRIQLRDDDADVIDRIKDNLQVGRVARHGQNGRTNPSVSWAVEKVDDLTEVIIPLFERYPLYTKKRDEFTIWKPVVLQRYIDTLGGHSNRRAIPDDNRTAFHEALNLIKQRRTYGH